MDSNNYPSFMHDNSEVIVLKQLFNVVDNVFKCKGNYTNVIKLFMANSFKIIVIFITQYFVRHPDEVSSWIKYLLVKIMYRRLIIKGNLDDSSHKDYHVNQIFKKEITEPVLCNDESKKTNKNQKYLTIKSMPIYLTEQSNSLIIEYFAPLHNKFIQYINDTANKDLDDSSKADTEYKDIKNKVLAPFNMFPSKNYIKLEKIISSFFSVVKNTGMFKSQCILINGEPGLGKSRSSDYLAYLNKYDQVYYINMSLTTLLKRDFNTIIDDIIKVKTIKTTIIYFDELDKYLEYNIDLNYQKYLEKITRQNKNKKEKNIQDDDVHNNFKKKQKIDFLYKLLELMEVKLYENGVIFCLLF